ISLCPGRAPPRAVVQQGPLTEAARAAGVLRDEIVQTRPQRPKPGVEYVDHPWRRVVIAAAQGRPRADRPRTEEVILYTNLLDVPRRCWRPSTPRAGRSSCSSASSSTFWAAGGCSRARAKA